jgi:hypothetical protein
MKAMSGPRRTKGETLPASSDVIDRLKKQTETKVPVVRQHATAPNAHVVPSRRGNSAHSIVPPPPDGAGEGDEDEVVIEMSGDDEEDDPRPRRSRSDTLADPMTTEKLAESARHAPPPPAPTPAGPNRHVKRR